MTTVAEGVEKQEELDLLWHMGCDQSQGYLHSPAVTASDFANLLQFGKGVLMQPAERPGDEDNEGQGALRSSG
jgi:predicted signal transduction protein with EAL and GGDEF domain